MRLIREITIEGRDYEHGELRRSMLFPTPIQQLIWWLEEAVSMKILEATAMALSTQSKNGPSSRMVLLKGIDEVTGSLFFYTDYRSQKAQEIDEGHNISLLFHWKELDRQVIINAKAIRTNREMSEQYFAKRDREKQIARWASKQGTPVSSRDELIAEYKKCEAKFEGRNVPCPEFWGGYECIPFRFEFWQGRQNPLHDRFVYEKNGQKLPNVEWTIQRLNP